MIYSLVGKTIEQGGFTGVSRFDFMLRRIFPGLRSVTSCPAGLTPNDVTICDNHLSATLPPEARVVTVHHGCASTHYTRDPRWQTEQAAEFVRLQGEMFRKPNRVYVAPGAWVAERFREEYGLRNYSPLLIPYWVDPIARSAHVPTRPLVIGDWRDNNKGSRIWEALARCSPEWDFEPLARGPDDAARRDQYGRASVYLCLSVSEGGAYAMCDAEAAGVPIVTTDVGNYQEFNDAEVISWADRGDVPTVKAAITRRLARCRQSCFYDRYSFDDWARRWAGAVKAASVTRAPVSA